MFDALAERSFSTNGIKCRTSKINEALALRDIAFSNSPIEAVNRIFKRYLRHWQPQTEAAFQAMGKAICARLLGASTSWFVGRSHSH